MRALAHIGLMAALLSGTQALTGIEAAAGTQDRVRFQSAPHVVVDIRHTAPGEATIRVASNAPFHITASDVVGEVEVKLAHTGINAQAPGPEATCAIAMGRGGAIYSATRRTAKLPGGPESQSAVFEVSYPRVASPVFGVGTGRAPTTGYC